METPTDAPTTPPIPASRWLAVALIVAMGAVALGITVRAMPSDHADTNAMVNVSPGGHVELASLSSDHQALYLAAADDPEAFEAVACYCGCESFLDHRHLLDCFVRPDGGWERHATGCAVCLAEARQVLELRDDEVPIEEIARRIDDRFGAITDPTAA